MVLLLKEKAELIEAAAERLHAVAPHCLCPW